MQVIAFVAVLVYRAPPSEMGNIVDVRVVWRNLDVLLVFSDKEYCLAPPLCRLDHLKHLRLLLHMNGLTVEQYVMPGV